MKKEIEIIKRKTSLLERGKIRESKKLRVAAYCRVSTDDKDQLNSYESQVKHYRQLITQNEEWIFVDVFADKAITGTKIDKRDDFKRLISACMNGEVDLILTKSIARFARNTVDTLKYVRMLKEKYVAVIFEEEKINTMTMDGELLLTVLSSVAQQEVENISANVKKGLKMKMQRGEIVGYNGCLGYNYNIKNKTITVNQAEAEIVQYIFNRYVEGYGASIIAKELSNMGVLTKRGCKRWHSSGVRGILKNEKYIGDIMMGKTFTVDPITKRRLHNMGEEDKVYIRNHHEPIVSKTIFYKVQEIMAERGGGKDRAEPFNRKRNSRQYAFSSLIKCGFCGSTLSRRAWNAGSKYGKTMWECIARVNKGKRFCTESRGVNEELIEKAFLESYRRISDDNAELLEEFLAELVADLSEKKNENKNIDELEEKIFQLKNEKAKALDLMIKGVIDINDYNEKKEFVDNEISELEYQKSIYKKSVYEAEDMEKRISKFKTYLLQNYDITEFDRGLFESLIKCVIVGGYNDGIPDSNLITFVYKFGVSSDKDVLDDNKENLIKNDIPEYKELFDFNVDYKHMIFVKDEKNILHKTVQSQCQIKVAIAV